MTKKELQEKALNILTSNGIRKSADVYVQIQELLEPKLAGVKLNLADYATLNENGKAVEIICGLSGVALPASKEFFYSDKNSKIECENGEFVSRHSLQAIKIKREFDKTIAASSAAITTDVMDEVITPADGKTKLEELKALKPDYSTVTRELPVADNSEAETPAE